jgi:hypothetical protein
MNVESESLERQRLAIYKIEAAYWHWQRSQYSQA